MFPLARGEHLCHLMAVLNTRKYLEIQNRAVAQNLTVRFQFDGRLKAATHGKLR